MWGNKKVNEEVQEQNQAITEFDTAVVEDEDSLIIEVDEDFGGTGVIFDAEKDCVTIEEEDFDTLVDSNGMFELEFKETDDSGQEVVKKRKVKAFKRRKKKPDYSIGIMTEENYGVLLPFVKDDNITDINWNGKELWIDDITKGRYASDIKLTDDFVSAFSTRVSNVVSKAFNKYTPSLEAETEDLRVTVVHESVSHTGRAISIRKTPAIKRINFMESIRNGSYCSEEVANLMSNAVKAKCNIVIIGLPGVGKTELAKFLTNYIFPFDRVITIEDTLEIHYSQINPGKDCLELKVDEQFDYTEAIKTSLRLLPQWIMLSEARSTEVKYLIEAVSTGAKCITTLHTDDVKKVPDRILNMIGSTTDKDATLNSIYSFFDFGILISKHQDDKTGKIVRWVDQICSYNREDGKNFTTMLVDSGRYTGEDVSDEMKKRFELAGISNPFQYTYI